MDVSWIIHEMNLINFDGVIKWLCDFIWQFELFWEIWLLMLIFLLRNMIIYIDSIIKKHRWWCRFKCWEFWFKLLSPFWKILMITLIKLLRNFEKNIGSIVKQGVDALMSIMNYDDISIIENKWIMMSSLVLKDLIDDDDSTTEVMICLISLYDVYMYCVDSFHSLMHYLKMLICLDFTI